MTTTAFLSSEGATRTPFRTPDTVFAANSRSVAGWTLVSRGTGLVRLVVGAAILGPTWLGNLFQSTNVLPNVLYELAVGSLIGPILVPALVRVLDLGGPARTTRMARGFLGIVMCGFAAVAVLVAAASPLVLRAFSAGVTPSLAGDYRRLGVPLLLLVLPQMVLYGMIAVATSVQNAHGRFAFSSFAPVIENVITIATLVAVGVRFGTGRELDGVPLSMIVFLGVGSTAAVTAHAALQWLGARSVGVVLYPRNGWRDPELRAMSRAARHSAGSALAVAARQLSILGIAGTVAGGVVAMQFGLNVIQAAVALGARPVAIAALPDLSRQATGKTDFGRTYRFTATLAMFVLIPAGVLVTVLAGVLAPVVAFGEMASPHGLQLLTAALRGIGMAAIGEGGFLLATSAAYARGDTLSPLRAAALRAVVVVVAVSAVAVAPLRDTTTLLGIGLVVSCADLVAAAMVHVALPAPAARLRRQTRRRLPICLAAALVASVPALAVASVDGLAGTRTGGLAGIAIGLVTYLGLGLVGRSPELAALAPRSSLFRIPRWLRSPSPWLVWPLFALACAALALLVGPAVAFTGAKGVAAFGALVIVAVTLHRPVVASYLFLAITPLVVGIDRGSLIPLLRPNEALLAVLAAGVITRAVLDPNAKAPRRCALDVPVAALAFLSSVPPLLWLAARGLPVEMDDLLHATILPKYALVYAIVRWTVRTPRQVQRCLAIVLASGVVVGGIAVLQALRIFGISRFLERYTSDGDTAALDIGRGSSLLGNSVATGFFMTAVVLVAVSLLLHRRWGSFWLAGLIGLLVLGALASGQFSGVLVLAVGLLILGAITGRLAEVVMFGTPTALVSAVLIWPVIATRLSGFSSSEGLPSSWQVRWENLTVHVWPRLGDLNFVLGVRPSTRIAAPEVWRPWIYIENGHTYLLWAGGLPLLAAYLWLTLRGLRATATDRHHPEPTLAATSAAVHALLWALTVAMFFDPHLTLRGSADLLFPLLALTGVASGRIHLILEGSSNAQPNAAPVGHRAPPNAALVS